MKISPFLLILILIFSPKIKAQQLLDYLPKDGLVGWWTFTGNAKDSTLSQVFRYSASTGDPFNGVIDDAGICNRTLSDNEISQLFNASLDTKGNVGINIVNTAANLQVNDVLRLEPRSFAPASPSMGYIYIDDRLKKLRVFDGNAWKNCW